MSSLPRPPTTVSASRLRRCLAGCQRGLFPRLLTIYVENAKIVRPKRKIRVTSDVEPMPGLIMSGFKKRERYTAGPLESRHDLDPIRGNRGPRQRLLGVNHAPLRFAGSGAIS